jgi:hypothetical protein
MRYTRLRRQIESGTLVATRGTPFLSHSSSLPTSTSSHNPDKLKRKRVSGEDEEIIFKRDDVKQLERGIKAERETVEAREGKIKREDEGSGVWDSGSGSETDEGWDSEDEVPLAKLRKATLSSFVAQNTAPTQHVMGAAVQETRAGMDGVSLGYGKEGVSGQQHMNRAAVPRYITPSEARAWVGMIPVGNAGIQNSRYPVYWGNGYSGGGAWEQG